MASKPQLKEQDMATRETPKTEIDISKLSVVEMLELADMLKKSAVEQSAKMFDETVNNLCEKLKRLGRTKADAIKALETLMDANELASYKKATKAVKSIRTPRGSVSAKKAHAFEKGVTYKYQADSWVGGTKGRRPPWLRDLVPDTLTVDEAKAKYAELAVK